MPLDKFYSSFTQRPRHSVSSDAISRNQLSETLKSILEFDKDTLNVKKRRLTNVVHPVTATDAATMDYVDNSTLDTILHVDKIMEQLPRMHEKDQSMYDCQFKRLANVAGPLNEFDVTTRAYVDKSILSSKKHVDKIIEQMPRAHDYDQSFYDCQFKRLANVAPPWYEFDAATKQFCIDSVHTVVHLQSTDMNKVQLKKTGEMKAMYVLNVNNLPHYALPFTGIAKFNFKYPELVLVYLNEELINSSSSFKVYKGDLLMFEVIIIESVVPALRPLFVELVIQSE